MTGDNSQGMKEARAYERLICAIIEHKPDRIIERLVYEAVSGSDCTNLIGFEEVCKQMRADATRDALNYYSHRQGGRSVIVHKNSPLGRRLAKLAFSDSSEGD